MAVISTTDGHFACVVVVARLRRRLRLAAATDAAGACHAMRNAIARMLNNRNLDRVGVGHAMEPPEQSLRDKFREIGPRKTNESTLVQSTP